MSHLNILVNLPAGFFTSPALTGAFARLAQHGTVRTTSHDTAEQITNDLAWADVVLMWSWPILDNMLLDAAPRLRFSGQLDITQRAARIALDRGLPVSVTRRAFSPAVAEMALGLILNTLRKISVHQGAMRTGTEQWVAGFPEDIDPDERELSGRAVGLIGFGAVGQRLCELLQPFCCHLCTYDPFVPEGVAERAGVRRTDLHTLLAASEVVVLCAASNAGTAHLLAAPEIALLPPRAVLVNVARAALVDTPALIARLRQGDLYAALDVFDQEPLPADAELRTLPNAFLTPHRAGGILDSVSRLLNQLIDDLEAYLDELPRTHALAESWLPSLDA